MPFSPDAPFPKSPGHPIMAKDWNDSITELMRLETAKVNRAGDAVTGPLTIAAALGVGTASPAARLHVVDSASPAIARVQSTRSFGAARLELWSDPQNTANEWRPGFIESFDTGSFTGGLRFVTNGTGAANKKAESEQLRLWNGKAGFGVTDPGFRIDALGRIRIRQVAGGDTAGLWLHAATPNANRAFIGLATDSSVGFWGENGGQWGLTMDTATGNVTQLTTSNPAVLRIQSRGAFGVARVEMWSDPPGTANEWRPGYIESFDTGNFTGGLRFVTNGTGTGNKEGSSEQMRLWNGRAGIGVTDPGYRLDVGGRIRLREGGGTAGLWLHHSATPNDRAFVGMASDNSVGFWGNTGAQWGLQMDTSTGDVSVKGRVWSNNYRAEAAAGGQVQTTSGSYVLIPNMTLTFTLPAQRPVWIFLHLPGVQLTGGNWAQSAGYFRLVIDTTEVAYTRQEWNHNGWELRSVVLTRLWTLTAGRHTVKAEWYSGSGNTLTGCWYNEVRTLQVFEL